MLQNHHLPGGENTRYLLGDGKFRFACHSGVACYTRCCHNADMYLYPYDIIRLKDCLGLTSAEFLTQYTITAIRENPYFPNVMLKMSDKTGNPCPFLSDNGCRVYPDRPYSCRAYPLEPAFSGDGQNRQTLHCYVACHGHCLGHQEEQEWTAMQWIQDQEMADYHEINAKWAQIDSLFRRNPFGENPLESPALKMAYMASYNLDTFRRFVFDSSFLSRYEVPPRRLEAVRSSDTELLLLGFDWILRFLGGQGPLTERQMRE
jgi:hypothetical protein